MRTVLCGRRRESFQLMLSKELRDRHDQLQECARSGLPDPQPNRNVLGRLFVWDWALLELRDLSSLEEELGSLDSIVARLTGWKDHIAGISIALEMHDQSFGPGCTKLISHTRIAVMVT